MYLCVVSRKWYHQTRNGLFLLYPSEFMPCHSVPTEFHLTHLLLYECAFIPYVLLQIPRLKQKNNIKMYIYEIEWDCTEGLELTQYFYKYDKWTYKFHKCENFLTVWGTVIFSWRTSFHGPCWRLVVFLSPCDKTDYTRISVQDQNLWVISASD